MVFTSVTGRSECRCTDRFLDVAYHVNCNAMHMIMGMV